MFSIRKQLTDLRCMRYPAFWASPVLGGMNGMSMGGSAWYRWALCFSMVSMRSTVLLVSWPSSACTLHKDQFHSMSVLQSQSVIQISAQLTTVNVHELVQWVICSDQFNWQFNCLLKFSSEKQNKTTQQSNKCLDKQCDHFAHCEVN